MTRRLLVNDALTQIEGTRTFWHDLQKWFGCQPVTGDFAILAEKADITAKQILDSNIYTVENENDELWPTLIIRNASYFGPLKASERVPTISLLQDILPDGENRRVQEAVIKSSRVVVYNSSFTASKYPRNRQHPTPLTPLNLNVTDTVIPLPVDFSVFEPGNPMGLQQALGLPDGCVLWVGASQGAAGHIKGWDIFLSVVRLNPDLNFVAVFKDAPPDTIPPNLRVYARLPHADLVKVIGACRVGLCTSRSETQHLAGIEMGACGLPLVVPPVGTYWKREGMPGFVSALDAVPVPFYTHGIRVCLSNPPNVDQTRSYWQKEFDSSVVRAAWELLINEVEKGD